MEAKLTLNETIDATAAARRPWDAVVVGAGPAGALAARELARSGAEVLLLDRQRFPRHKVCGGCLNGRTLALLEEAGLGGLVESLGGVPLERFELATGDAPAAVPLPRGMALSRTAMDAALVTEAVAAGARFLPETRALLGDAGERYRTVRLPERALELEASVVLAADGLGGGFLAGDPSRRPKTARDSRIGAGAELERPVAGYRPGTIYMAVGAGGYVGLTVVEGRRLNVAAALDRELVQEAGLGDAVARLVEESGLPPIDIRGARFKGTAALTRMAPSLAHERVFLIGDAAGYVEPFTGEGISWALETALTAAPLAARAAADWRPSLARRWHREYRRRITRRQRWCRAVAWGLKRPPLVRGAAWALEHAPRLARPLVAHLNAAPAGRKS